ncbi:carbohydrate sulfotransferase 15-like [Elysia marginata]|uniref:Carbohydrate sulfotransferase 15-like n=1 Tax=Elysia marginata TaxID=1093978 RepID=A0AAV4FI78_9GAST|nr:carbohydrate sulfotransferase 15-like [Elysia marginata]
MLPSRGRVLRVTSACLSLIGLAYLATLTSTWKTSGGVTSYFSTAAAAADDNHNQHGGPGGTGSRVVRTHSKQSSKPVMTHLQDGQWKSDDVIKKKPINVQGGLEDEDLRQPGFVRKSDKMQGFPSLDSVTESVGNEKEEEPSPRYKEREAIPPALANLISNWSELKGRHSDYITAPCQNKSSPSLSDLGEQRYGFIGPFPYLKNYKNPCWLPKGSTQVLCVPYFYLIGAPKAGSTDVFWRIKGHPHVTSGKAKEVRWFDRLRFPLEKGTQAAMPNFEDYLEFFERPTRYVQNATVRLKNGTIFHHRVIGMYVFPK